jgi:transcriptional regulator CtsR
MQPKVSFTRSVISAHDGNPFILNQIFVDGDPITIEQREFDLVFYLQYVDRIPQSEEDLINFLKQFDTSFQSNSWYQKREGSLLHALITKSRWNSAYLKAQFGCLQYEDGLTFLESDELKQYGYEPLLRAFKIKYANTSTSIVTDADVAQKLEEWMPRTAFNDYINQLFDEQIQSFKTRKKTCFDQELKEWRSYDGSLEAKKKIFLSQFSRYPEFEAKRRIIQKLIRKAENEVRVQKGYTVVGTLVNESILYSRLKEHFSSYTVVSQYRPKWLGRQSLDIYIEELKVVVEYQGDQHSRPVEFFGGAEAFEKTKQRDLKKWDRCRRNGCRLIYVYLGYDIFEVISQIMGEKK